MQFRKGRQQPLRVTASSWRRSGGESLLSCALVWSCRGTQELCAALRVAAGGRCCTAVASPSTPGAWSLGSVQICFCFFSTSVLRFSPSDLERKTEMKGSLRGDCGLSFPSCAQCKPTLMRPFEKGG